MLVYTVYADVLWLINFLLDGVLLWATARFAGVAVRGWRLGLAAALGAVYGVGLLFAALAPLYVMPLPLLLPPLMLLVAFGRMRPGRFAWLLLCFFLLAALMAGAALAVRLLLAGSLVGVSAGWLVPCVLAAAVPALLSVGYVRRCIRQSGLAVLACITLDGRKVQVRCFLDSGNTLREPVGGRPVLIVELPVLLPLLPGDFYAELAHGLLRQAAGDDSFRPYQLLLKIQGLPFGRHLTLLPYAGVEGAGRLGLGLLPDDVCYQLADGRKIHPAALPVLLPVGTGFGGINGCRGLLNPAAVFAADDYGECACDFNSDADTERRLVI